MKQTAWTCDYEDQRGAGGRRLATQVARQLAEPHPDDLSEIELADS